MLRVHKKRAAPEKSDPILNERKLNTEQSIFNSTIPGSNLELLAIFDAAVYRALLIEQQKIAVFLAGGRHV